MTSGLGFGQVDLFQSNPKVKGTCFPSFYSISSSSVTSLHLFDSPLYSFLHSSPSLTSLLLFQFEIPLILQSSLHLPLYFIPFLPHYFLSFHPLLSPFWPPHIHSSIPPSIQPSLHVLIPSSIRASLPLSPIMCLSLVIKQYRPQMVQTLTC